MPNRKQRNLGIVLILALFLGGAALFFYQTQRADFNNQNRSRLVKVEQNLMLFRLHNGRFPTNSEGLAALSNAPTGLATWKGPYLAEGSLHDIWGQPLQYEIVDARSFHLKSAGPDGSFGSADDVIYPQKGNTHP